MAIYLDYLGYINKRATIRRRINSLGTIMKLSKIYDPTKESEVVLTLKRMHRKIATAQEQFVPITKIVLEQLLNRFDNPIRGIRSQALIDWVKTRCVDALNSAPSDLDASPIYSTANQLSD